LNIKICKLRAFHVTVATPPDLANAILESLNLPVEPPAKTKPLEISQSSRLRKQDVDISVEPPAVDTSVEQDTDAETVAAQALEQVATKKETEKTLVHVAKEKVTKKPACSTKKRPAPAPPDRTPKYKASRLDMYVASEDW